MKVSVCDICWHTKANGGRTLSEALFNLSYKRGAEKIKIHACQAHQYFFKACNSYEDAKKKYSDLVLS